MKEVSGQWGFGPGSADLPLRWKGRGGFKVDLPAGLYFSALYQRGGDWAGCISQAAHQRLWPTSANGSHWGPGKGRSRDVSPSLLTPWGESLVATASPLHLQLPRTASAAKAPASVGRSGCLPHSTHSGNMVSLMRVTCAPGAGAGSASPSCSG